LRRPAESDSESSERNADEDDEQGSEGLFYSNSSVHSRRINLPDDRKHRPRASQARRRLEEERRRERQAAARRVEEAVAIQTAKEAMPMVTCQRDSSLHSTLVQIADAETHRRMMEVRRRNREAKEMDELMRLEAAWEGAAACKQAEQRKAYADARKREDDVLSASANEEADRVQQKNELRSLEDDEELTQQVLHIMRRNGTVSGISPPEQRDDEQPKTSSVLVIRYKRDSVHSRNAARKGSLFGIDLQRYSVDGIVDERMRSVKG
jgi:hypothetical protein